MMYILGIKTRNTVWQTKNDGFVCKKNIKWSIYIETIWRCIFFFNYYHNSPWLISRTPWNGFSDKKETKLLYKCWAFCHMAPKNAVACQIDVGIFYLLTISVHC